MGSALPSPRAAVIEVFFDGVALEHLFIEAGEVALRVSLPASRSAALRWVEVGGVPYVGASLHEDGASTPLPAIGLERAFELCEGGLTVRVIAAEPMRALRGGSRSRAQSIAIAVLAPVLALLTVIPIIGLVAAFGSLREGERLRELELADELYQRAVALRSAQLPFAVSWRAAARRAATPRRVEQAKPAKPAKPAQHEEASLAPEQPTSAAAAAAPAAATSATGNAQPAQSDARQHAELHDESVERRQEKTLEAKRAAMSILGAVEQLERGPTLGAETQAAIEEAVRAASASGARPASGMGSVAGAATGSGSATGTGTATGTGSATGSGMATGADSAAETGGLGLSGTATGGGGEGEGTIGLGELGTIGHGGGTGEGEGYGDGRGSLQGHRTVDPIVVSGAANISSALDREMIRRVVRAHLNEVRACYELELQFDAAITGRVSTLFHIAPSGDVTSAQSEASGMAVGSAGARKVTSCVTDAVRRWRFPRVLSPRGTTVRYPFLFDFAGGE